MILYEFNLNEHSYKPDLIVWFVVCAMVLSIYILKCNGKSQKAIWGFSVIVSLLVVSEIFDAFRFFSNVQSIALGRTEKFGGCISGVDETFKKRITSEIEFFFVGEKKIQFDVKGARYAYNTPISKNKFIREGYYFEGFFHDDDLVSFKIIDGACDKRPNQSARTGVIKRKRH